VQSGSEGCDTLFAPVQSNTREINTVLRRVKTFNAFYESLSALDRSPETTETGAVLLLRVVNRPESVPPVPGFRIRVMRTASHGAFPALRVLYAVDDTTISLMCIEQYDELAD